MSAYKELELAETERDEYEAREAIKWECREDVLEKCVESCMTYKDAIKHIDSIRVNNPNLRIALDIAIEALGKQIPKKPIITRYYQGAHDMLPDLDAAECPNCGTWNVGMNEYGVKFDFCIYCGQAIDWTEEVSND